MHVPIDGDGMWLDVPRFRDEANVGAGGVACVPLGAVFVVDVVEDGDSGRSTFWRSSPSRRSFDHDFS
jgi:hypothetical protein